MARDFQITLGPNSIPVLLRDINVNNDDDDDDDYIDSNSTHFDLNHAKNNYTGKILVDLSDEKCGLVQLELETPENEMNLKHLHTIELPNVKLTYEVVPFLLKLSIAENVDFLQMFDTSMLMSNAAFDDNTVMECVLEKINEWKEYPRSMAIFDVDSLIGVSENMSDSSMGQSNSYSITNNRLWQQVVIQTANSKLNDSDTSSKRDHKWIVVISKNEFVCKQFKSLTRFPLTRKESDDLENSLKTRECLNCKLEYMNGKNNIDACSYHDGPLIDVRVNNEDMIHLDKHGLDVSFVKLDAKNRQEMLKNFMYLCCFQTFNSSGCRKSSHSDEQNKKDIVKYKRYFK